MAKFC